MKLKITAKRAFPLFVAIVVGVLIQAIWWVIFMAKLLDEKVKMAELFGADQAFIDQMHEQEISRQIMLGSEGLLFLGVIIFGAWLIYRALVLTEATKLRQHNFLLSVTHELKTPIASLRIYLDTLASTKIAEEKKKQIIPRMKEDTVRLERMVNNILEATRFDHQKYLLDPTEVDLSRMISDAVSYLNSTAEVIPRRITTTIPPDIFIEADPKALRRAIDAVLENSLKYHDGKQVQMDIRLEQTGRRVVVTVADQGVGFDPRESETLFDRFYRVGSEMTRSADGTGLGLYLCREIVRAHGGDVRAESKGAGTGARFMIELKGMRANEDNTAG